jgi:hypothetical protein
MKVTSRFRNLEIAVSLLLMASVSAWAWEDIGGQLDAYELRRERSQKPEFDIKSGCQGKQLNKIMGKVEDYWADGERSGNDEIFSDIDDCSIYEYEPSLVTSSSGGSRPTKHRTGHAAVLIIPTYSYRVGMAVCETAKEKAGQDNDKFNRQITLQLKIFKGYLRTLSAAICTLEQQNIESDKTNQVVYTGDLLQICIAENHQPEDSFDPYSSHIAYYRSRLGILYVDPILLNKELGNPSSARLLTITEIFHPESIEFPLASTSPTKPRINYEPDVVLDSTGKPRYR